MERGGPRELESRVLTANLCTGCGACVGHCPYLKTLGERVAFVHPCSLPEGRCFAVCPRTALDPDELDQRVFGRPRVDPLLGSYRRLLWGRALEDDIRARSQYGGVATALAAFSLASGTTTVAAVTGGTPTSLPEPVVARDRAAVLASSGTKYTACPTLAPVTRLLRERAETVGMVGRPCQVEAARRMEARGTDRRLGLVIGLFCFWALAPSFYRFIKARGGLGRATKMDIPKDGGVVFSTNGAETVVPLDEVRPHIRPACQTCFDPTAEWADVSVGSTEHDPGWNTVVVRTALGESIVDAAVAAGVLETMPYPPDRIPILRTAVRGKKQRVLAAVQAGRADAAYLRLSDETRAAVAGAARDRR